jgi:hypothetical protein
MKITVGAKFSVLKFTGIVEFVGESSDLIRFARISSSGFTRSGIGDLSIQFPCEGTWRVCMLLAIPAEFHDPHVAEQIRLAVFSALEIPNTESWQLLISPAPVAEIFSKPVEGVIMLTSSG